MGFSDYERASLFAGVTSVVLTNVAILAAVAASPAFRWSENALSNLGQPGTTSATPLTTALFGGGLILGGALGVAFAVALWTTARNLVQKLSVPVFVLAMVSLAGVGIFPQSQPLHAPAAISFYLLSMVAMALSGAGALVSGRRPRGAVTLALVVAHVGVWWWWSTGGPIFRAGLAIPELAGALVVTAWVLLVALDGLGTTRRSSSTLK